MSAFRQKESVEQLLKSIDTQQLVESMVWHLNKSNNHTDITARVGEILLLVGLDGGRVKAQLQFKLTTDADEFISK